MRYLFNSIYFSFRFRKVGWFLRMFGIYGHNTWPFQGGLQKVCLKKNDPLMQERKKREKENLTKLSNDNNNNTNNEK